jgi:hypothetical protein
MVAAVVVTLLLMGLSVSYHDGVFGTQSLSSLQEPGPYRVKGVLAHYDPTSEAILVRDGADQETLHWNITQPDVGRVYVIDLEVLPNGTLEALALTPVFVFK